jgi:hypothetical protein
MRQNGKINLLHQMFDKWGRYAVIISSIGTSVWVLFHGVHSICGLAAIVSHHFSQLFPSALEQNHSPPCLTHPDDDFHW